MNKLFVSLLMLATSLSSFSMAQNATEDLVSINSLNPTEASSLSKLLGITSNEEKDQFLTDIEACTKAYYVLEKITNTDSNPNIKDVDTSSYLIRNNELSQFYITVTLFNMKIASYGSFSRAHPELKIFFKQVNDAVGRGIKAGEATGDSEINAIKNGADFLPIFNEYANTIETLKNGKFGAIIKSLR